MNATEETVGNTVLTAHGLTKRFGSFAAVSGLDLTVTPGKITALIGPNGAGKSTVINLLSGLLLPSAGEVRFAGESVRGMHPFEFARLGVLRTFQTPRLFPGLTAAETVMLGHQAHTSSPWLHAILRTPRVRRQEQERRMVALEMLEAAGVGDVGEQEVTGLAVGTQRLVELARALAGQPTVLLLDEPGAGLDLTESAALGQLLVEIAAGGPAVLLVEHDMGMVMSVADVVLVLDAGVLIAAGTPAEVSRDQHVIEAYLGPQDA